MNVTVEYYPNDNELSLSGLAYFSGNKRQINVPMNERNLEPWSYAANRLGMNGTPMTIITDRSGEIIRKIVGMPAGRETPQANSYDLLLKPLTLYSNRD